MNDRWRRTSGLTTFLATLFLPTWLAVASLRCTALQADDVVDVVVYGGTVAGVSTAIQTIRLGKSAVLIEPSNEIGGMTISGLGFTDTGDKSKIGGLTREFYRRVKRHYDRPEAWKFQQPDDHGRYRPTDDAMWTFEPHVAQAILQAMLREASVPVIRGERLNRETGVVVANRRIQAISMESGRRFAGQVFVDATYEGDLMAAAGVSYTVGRESNEEYGETLNGVQPSLNLYNHRFLRPVDPYVTPGDPASGLVAGVQNEAPGREGTGDSRVQAYCFRMCMTRIPENRVPFPKPEGYDEDRFELLFRNFAAGDLRLPFSPDEIPNHKTDTNNLGAISTDNIGQNYEYPEASYEQREAIIRDHIVYQQGFMWTLANHPRIPESIRHQMQDWGLAKDEFVTNDHWPHQLYIRESRRLLGQYVMTEHDCRRQRLVPDSVGMGSYNMDSHNTQRYVQRDGSVANEGDVQVSPGGPYRISYRSLVPRHDEIQNLLVPVCLSASHIAYGSIRMEPVFMILGQSSATAAVQAIDTQRAVQTVDYARLAEQLKADGQVLE